jgi:hypothetical protein
MKLEKIQTENQDLTRIQYNIAKAYDTLGEVPLNAGRLIENVALSSTAVSIEHKLGREFRGWIIVRTNANQTVWESTQLAPKTLLKLVASGSVTVSLFVF